METPVASEDSSSVQRTDKSGTMGDHGVVLVGPVSSAPSHARISTVGTPMLASPDQRREHVSVSRPGACAVAASIVSKRYAPNGATLVSPYGGTTASPPARAAVATAASVMTLAPGDNCTAAGKPGGLTATAAATSAVKPAPTSSATADALTLRPPLYVAMPALRIGVSVGVGRDTLVHVLHAKRLVSVDGVSSADWRAHLRTRVETCTKRGAPAGRDTVTLTADVVLPRAEAVNATGYPSTCTITYSIVVAPAPGRGEGVGLPSSVTVMLHDVAVTTPSNCLVECGAGVLLEVACRLKVGVTVDVGVSVGSFALLHVYPTDRKNCSPK